MPQAHTTYVTCTLTLLLRILVSKSRRRVQLFARNLCPETLLRPLGHCLHCCTLQCTAVQCSAVPSSALQKQSLWPWGTKAQLPYALFIRKVHRVLSFSLKRSAYFTKFGTLKAKFNRRFLVFWC